MTKELAESLEKYPLYSQEGKKEDAVVVAKFFFPATALTWYVTEGKKEDDDYLFFGLVVGGKAERVCPRGSNTLGFSTHGYSLSRSQKVTCTMSPKLFPICLRMSFRTPMM